MLEEFTLSLKETEQNLEIIEEEFKTMILYIMDEIVFFDRDCYETNSDIIMYDISRYIDNYMTSLKKDNYFLYLDVECVLNDNDFFIDDLFYYYKLINDEILFISEDDVTPQIEVIFTENILSSLHVPANELPVHINKDVINTECLTQSVMIDKADGDMKTLELRMNELRQKYQPEQRTNDWYIFRYNLLSASNAYKAIGRQAERNSLICEKCQPLKQVSETVSEEPKSINLNSPLHWGQKYEPLSILLYESHNDAEIEEYGCIQHDNYDFIGASPDGINIKKNSHLFGRMLEIKNVVSRIINGIPKREYWVQMQLQMEVCDLDLCDFVETKFIEYSNEESFVDDKVHNSEKGVILYFNDNNNKPYYIYKPLHLSNYAYDEWQAEQMTTYSSEPYNMTWIKNIYWKLDRYSCVLVKRDREWFLENIDTFKETWDTILRERVEGFSHRLPKARIKKEITPSDNIMVTDGKCFIKLKK